jgi:hypothetical protein
LRRGQLGDDLAGRPCSMSWMAAVAVSGFVMDAIQKIESAVMGPSPATLRRPKAPW